MSCVNCPSVKSWFVYSISIIILLTITCPTTSIFIRLAKCYCTMLTALRAVSNRFPTRKEDADYTRLFSSGLTNKKLSRELRELFLLDNFALLQLLLLSIICWKVKTYIFVTFEAVKPFGIILLWTVIVAWFLASTPALWTGTF